MIRLLVTVIAIALAAAVGWAASDSWGAWALLVALPAALLMGFGAGWLSDQLGGRR